MTPRIATEHEEQVALMQWAAMAACRYPQLQWLHAIPNAGAGAQRGQAGKMKAEGVKRGVPDLCLPVPMGGFHGAYIEMKRRQRSAMSPEQLAWREHLTRAGYAHYTAHGWIEARNAIALYLELPLLLDGPQIAPHMLTMECGIHTIPLVRA